MRRAIGLLGVLAVVVLVRTDALLGQSYNQVDFSSQANWTWAGYENAANLPNGIFLPGARTGETTLGGIPFNIKSNSAGYQAWNAYVENTGYGQESITMNVNVFGVTNVYTLINSFWGAPVPNSYASLIFTGANGATYTKSFIGDVDTRDYNDGPSVNGTTTTNVFSGTDINGITGVLDMQNIALPSVFANQTLTSIELIDNGTPGVERAILDGVTVETNSTPEPSSFVAWAGLAAMGAACLCMATAAGTESCELERQEVPVSLPQLVELKQKPRQSDLIPPIRHYYRRWSQHRAQARRKHGLDRKK